MKNNSIQSSVVFLEDSTVLSDLEVKCIKKCIGKGIVVFSYSEKIMKETDVRTICKTEGIEVEFIEVTQSDEIVLDKTVELSIEGELHIDVTFASPYHIMSLTPFGYLNGNEVVVTGENGSTVVNHSFLDYGRLDDKYTRIILTVKDQEITVSEIADKWKKEEEKLSDKEYKHIPNHRATIHRNITELYEQGFISKTDTWPAKYFFNSNQKLMLKITKKTDDRK